METIHLISLIVTAPFILYADHLGFLYVIGKKQILPESAVKKIHLIVILGLIALIISGIFLALPTIDFYLKDPIFLTKMGFVAALVINGIFIDRLMGVAYATPFNALSFKKKLIILASGGVSVVSWISATLIGLFVL